MALSYSVVDAMANGQPPWRMQLGAGAGARFCVGHVARCQVEGSQYKHIGCVRQSVVYTGPSTSSHTSSKHPQPATAVWATPDVAGVSCTLSATVQGYKGECDGSGLAADFAKGQAHRARR